MKLVLAAAATALITSAASAGETANGKIQVRIPNGWTAEAVQLDNADAVALISPDFNQSGAACLLGSGDDPGSSGKTQNELNATAEGISTEAFWKVFFTRPGVSNVTLISTGSKSRAGRSVPFAKASYDDAEAGPTIAKDALQIVPGRMLIVDCSAKASAYPAAESAFDVVIDSFGPLGGDVVASLPRSNGELAILSSSRPLPPGAGLEALSAKLHGMRRRQ